jgi:hypothetical protein
VQDVVRLVRDANVLQVVEFDLALLVEPSLPRQLGLLHLITQALLHALLLLDSLVLVHSVLRLAKLDALRQVQIHEHVILHLCDV